MANFAKFCKFLAASFSAVSKRNSARKYAFDSIFQALQDLHTFAPLQSQNFRKNRFEISAIFVKIQQKLKILQMLQMLRNFAKFQKFQLDNLVDFEKCCKTRIYLQKSVPIQPKRGNILPKLAKNWQLPYRVAARQRTGAALLRFGRAFAMDGAQGQHIARRRALTRRPRARDP